MADRADDEEEEDVLLVSEVDRPGHDRKPGVTERDRAGHERDRGQADAFRHAERDPVPAGRDRHSQEREKTPPDSSSKVAWAEAAKKSQQFLDRRKAKASENWESYLDMELRPGDILVHPRLGECTVERVEDDTAAWIRLPKSHRISKLALSVVKLERAGERDGVRVFKISAEKEG